ncbi:hypothetical protein HCN44_006640 [Aphidius gifuensis]|uniref:Rab5-interacting protein n=1 Tax=Aphidius gifuensis TaxID=684658 RepID=A0A834XXU5_APHGI|nr:respirasome Complex Assembly Factor 1 [Aphidius gifuensis]KAF7995533.1 hypothetical protein HCN44_006640 [Aphidius gifuensis]
MSPGNKNEKTLNGGKGGSSIWSRAITANSEWPDKEEFLDVIYWSRQVIGIIIGICWGIFPLKGLVALMLFALVNAGIIYIYISSFQQVDEEEFGGMWELTKEGFMTSFAGFLVTWIIIYSGLHFD